MVMHLVIPEINFKPQNSRDAIISILTSDWPLSLREIYVKIKKQYGYSSSYQAVFKSVNELLEKGVLYKNDKKYSINVDWIKKLQSFTDIVETNYYAKERMHQLSGIKDSKQNADILILNFETIFDAEKYLYYFIKDRLFKKNNESLYFQLKNEWRPLFYFRSEYNFHRKLIEKKHKIFVLCGGKSEIEKENKIFYDNIGVKFYLNKITSPQDSIILLDYYIQIFIPEDLRNKMNEYLEKKDTLSLLKNVLEKKSSIRVLITKDESLCKQIKASLNKELKIK